MPLINFPHTYCLKTSGLGRGGNVDASKKHVDVNAYIRIFIELKNDHL